MCACRQRKSFLIEDILNDINKYKCLSVPPGAPLACTARGEGGAGRRHTYPLCPQPLRVTWAPPTLGSASPACYQPAPTPLYSPYAAAAALRHAYSLDTGLSWWHGSAEAADSAACGSRRAGGQVRFTAAQSVALERRFAAARYLTPDQRRHLARDLRLTDRQVKTWFQNRRAKWRRSLPAADTTSRHPEEPTSRHDHRDTTPPPHPAHTSPRDGPRVLA